MTIQHHVPMLHITGCQDPMMWYRDMVGQLVPNLGWVNGDGYKSREPDGHSNMVRAHDAAPLEVLVFTHQLTQWPFNHFLHMPAGVRKAIITRSDSRSTEWTHTIKALEQMPEVTIHTGSPGEPAPAGQTRAQSAIETVANVATGWLLALAVTSVVLPAFGHDVTLSQNAAMTTIFTAVSLVRSYAFRRLFNYLQQRTS